MAALLTEMSSQYDHERSGTKRGVVIRAQIVTNTFNWPPVFSYKATNASLLNIVDEIAFLMHCGVDMDENGFEWSPKNGDPDITRTYLLPPSTAAQMTQWPEFNATQNSPVSWIKDRGISLLSGGNFSGGNASYIAKRHFLIVKADLGIHQSLQEGMEKAWREYYAAQKTKAQKAN